MGKDTDDLQWLLKRAWDNPGSQSSYIGLNNVWVRRQIFNKNINGRKHWADYPEDYIDVKETQREVYMLNNPAHTAPASIKFIGFLQDEAIIGGSDDNFVISELSLYRDGAFDHVRPIWDRKISMGLPFMACFNMTPRGTRNIGFKMIERLTGVSDPEDFAGEHDDVYVDVKTIRDLLIPDGQGGWKKAYSEEDIEKEKDSYMREFGNLNLYFQENEVNFTTVNAGLVYLGIENLIKEKRFCPVALDTTHNVYMAWDIGSKASYTRETHPDATACIVFQYYNAQAFIYDYQEWWGKGFAECMAELRAKGYMHYVRFGILPWDADRGSTMLSQAEECRQLWPEIEWRVLSKDGVEKGVRYGRELLQKLIINSGRCNHLLDCFMNYEYKRHDEAKTWSFKPRHSWASHGMDAYRYMAVGIKELDFMHWDAYANNPKDATPESYDTGEEQREPLPHEIAWAELRKEAMRDV